MTTSTPTPSGFFGPGYSASSLANTITFNTSTHADPCLPQLSNDEADAATGDYRRIVHAFLNMLFANYTALENKPTKLNMVRNVVEDPTTGELVRTYLIVERTNILDIEIAEE